jgi:hypothetical protein
MSEQPPIVVTIQPPESFVVELSAQQGPVGAQGLKGDKGDAGDTGSPGTTSWNGLEDKPDSFPPSDHGHAISDVTGLNSTLGELAISLPGHAWISESGNNATAELGDPRKPFATANAAATAGALYFHFGPGTWELSNLARDGRFNFYGTLQSFLTIIYDGQPGSDGVSRTEYDEGGNAIPGTPGNDGENYSVNLFFASDDSLPITLIIRGGLAGSGGTDALGNQALPGINGTASGSVQHLGFEFYAKDVDPAVSFVQWSGFASKVDLSYHTNNYSNPHLTTKAQVGLGSVENAAASALYIPKIPSSVANRMVRTVAGGNVGLTGITIDDSNELKGASALFATGEVGALFGAEDIRLGRIGGVLTPGLLIQGDSSITRRSANTLQVGTNGNGSLVLTNLTAMGTITSPTLEGVVALKSSEAFGTRFQLTYDGQVYGLPTGESGGCLRLSTGSTHSYISGGGFGYSTLNFYVQNVTTPQLLLHPDAGATFNANVAVAGNLNASGDITGTRFKSTVNPNVSMSWAGSNTWQMGDGGYNTEGSLALKYLFATGVDATQLAIKNQAVLSASGGTVFFGNYPQNAKVSIDCLNLTAGGVVQANDHIKSNNLLALASGNLQIGSGQSDRGVFIPGGIPCAAVTLGSETVPVLISSPVLTSSPRTVAQNSNGNASIEANSYDSGNAFASLLINGGGGGSAVLRLERTSQLLSLLSNNGLKLRNANDNAFTNLQVGNLTASGTLQADSLSANGTVCASIRSNVGIPRLVATIACAYNATAGNSIWCTNAAEDNTRVGINRSDDGTIIIAYGGSFGWHSGNDDVRTQAVSLGFDRVSADAVEINNGTVGQTRDLSLRNLTASGPITSAYQSSASDPSGSDIPSGSMRAWLNTSTNLLFLAANVGGTIRKAAFT